MSATNHSVNTAALAGIGIEDSDETIEALKAKLKASEEANAALRKKADDKQLADHHSTAANESRASSKERFAIVLDEARTKNEINPVPVGVNGRMYQLKRGTVLEVPIEVVNVLNDAVEDRAIAKEDAAGNPAGYDIRKARRFPFRNYGKVVNADGQRTGLKLPEFDAA